MSKNTMTHRILTATALILALFAFGFTVVLLGAMAHHMEQHQIPTVQEQRGAA